MQAVLDYMTEHREGLLKTLRQLVEIDSPSTVKEATDAIVEHVAGELKALGAEVRLLPNAESGNHLMARVPGGEGRYLVLCHLDTVWPVGEVARRPFTIAGGKATGPGIQDMKGGVAQLLWALRWLRETGAAPCRELVVIFNTDEEIGSPTSRALIEEEARRSDYVFCLEPPVPPKGAIKTARKGVGIFRVEIEGRASHAGADHEAGISAIEEMARVIQKLHEFTDYETGTTVNVGTAEAGSRINVVADSAKLGVDLRAVTMEAAVEMEEGILGLEPSLPGTTLTVTGGINRPPMERTPEIAAAFERVRELGLSIGLDLEEGSTGGGSDGNFTAALGVPTLDGLGAVGEGAHALREYVQVDELPRRAALLALVLKEFG